MREMNKQHLRISTEELSLQRFHNDVFEADDYKVVAIGVFRLPGTAGQADEKTCRLPVDCSGCFLLPVDKDQRRHVVITVLFVVNKWRCFIKMTGIKTTLK